VEDRVKTLKALLEDTDRRIALLAGEVSRRHTQEDVYVELGKLRNPISEPRLADSVSASPPPTEGPPIPSAPPSPPAAVVSPPAVGTEKERRPPSQTYSPRIVRSAAPLVPKPPPFAEQAAELYRAGFSPELIAARLGAALSEVELAIALAERRNPRENP
jgi:hypothetical protein